MGYFSQDIFDGKKDKSFVVILLTLFVLFTVIGVIEYKALRHSNGIFCYPLDDTFIHLALAKNFALHGNWGATKFGFESASSSILWTLVLSAYAYVFSNTVLLPFILNIIVGSFLIFIIQYWLKKQNVGATIQFIVLISVIFFTPLPILIVSGMEHTFQCLISFVFIYGFSDWLEAVSLRKNNSSTLP